MKKNKFVRGCIILFCLGFLAVGMVNISAADVAVKASSDKESIKNKLQAQKEKLESVQNDIALNEKKKEATQTEIDKMAIELDHIFHAIEELDETIKSTEADYEAKLALLKERSVVMYQTSNYSQLQMFIQSESLLDFLNRQSYYDAMLDKDKQLLEEVQILKIELEKKKQLQSESMADISKLKAEKEKMLADLESASADLSKLSAATKNMIDKLEAQEEGMRQESNQIGSNIQNSGSSSSGGSYTGGKMLWPSAASRYISSYFGMRIHPIYKYPRMHNGIDIAAAGGTNILAAADGKVIEATYNSGYGNYIVIDHGGGVSTLYAHASRRIAKVGDRVSRGQVIALVGTTGNSTGNHLHFEVRINGNPVNPLNYL